MKTYLPILKFKKGDLEALKKVSKPDNIIPLFDIEDDFNHKNLELLPNKFFYDADEIDTLNEFSEIISNYSNYNALPVRREYKHVKENCCYRINVDYDLKKLSDTISLDNKDVSGVSLLIDFIDVSSLQESKIDYAIDILDGVLNMQWENVFVSGTAIPKSMSLIDIGESLVDRIEWTVLYKKFKKHFTQINYSDYGIHHPEALRGFDPKIMSSSAKIRYTLEEKILILKGRSIKTHGSHQYHDLAKKIVDSGEYMGEKFSFGDKFIKDCSDRKRTGNPMNWITADLSHHFEVVTKQLSL